MRKENDFTTMVAFTRKVEPTVAYMCETNWDEKHVNESFPLNVGSTTVEKTITRWITPEERKNPRKLQRLLTTPILETEDTCHLSRTMDTLRVDFSVVFLGDVGIPCNCNVSEFEEKLRHNVANYVEKTGLKELAYRYAYNIASARFLWRNRYGAEEIDVVIEAGEMKLMVDAYDYPLVSFAHRAELEPLAEKIAEALAGKDTFLRVKVTAYARIGNGSPAFPSEEFVANKKSGDKRKILYQEGGFAAIRPQKIGNALRTIDTWYEEFGTDKGVGPISVEPFGYVRSRYKEFRNSEGKKDFYTLLDKFVHGEYIGEDDENFVVATLIRGGKFEIGEKVG